MSDLSLVIGGDLTVTADGDLTAATGSMAGQQRVLRRLLTNAGDYIWQLDYGAGLAAMIGAPADGAAITGIVRHQLVLEGAVAQTPTPAITVEAKGSIVSLSITYSDAGDGTTQTVGASLSL